MLKGASTTIRRNYQAFLHVLHIKQSARALAFELLNANGEIVKGEDDGIIVLRPGNRARVRFAFCSRPERIRPGMKIMFRDGLVRGAGIIKEIFEHKVGTVLENPYNMKRR